MSAADFSAEKRGTEIKRLADHVARDERMVRGLVKFLDASNAVKKLSDHELCKQVIEKVWGELVLGSEQDWLVDELVERFEERCGIERDEEGRVIPESSQGRAV
jgi:hypothetical protein